MRGYQISTILILILLLGFGIRVYFNLVSEGFSSEEDYFILRQVRSIRLGEGLQTEDKLSYGGKYSPLLPGFYYLLTGASYLSEVFAFKILPALVASLTTILVYLITSYVTNKHSLALLSAFLATLVPSYLNLSINTINSHPFVLTLFFLNIWLLIRVEKSKRALPWLVLGSIAFGVLSSFTIVLVLVVWLYMALLKLLDLRIQTKTLEYMLFLTFFNLAINQVVFLKAGFEGGLVSVLMNIPNSIFIKFFSNYSWVNAIRGIGLVVLTLGAYGLYVAIQKETKKHIAALLLVISFSMVILVPMRMVNTEVALSFLGVTLSIAAVYSADVFFTYFKRLRKASGILMGIFILLVTAPALISALNSLNPTPIAAQDEIQALRWIALNAKTDATILAPVEMGHMISYFSLRKNVADTNFLNSGDVEERLENIKKVYTTPYETEAIRVFDKYSVDYLIFNPKIASMFGIEKLQYAADKDCFQLVYDNTTQIFEIKCTLN